MNAVIRKAFGLIFVCAVACFVIFSAVSCRRPFDQKNNVLKVDTLQHLVNDIDATLILDEDTIQKRDDSMKIKLAVIQQKYTDTTDGETREAIIRYNGIHHNYIDFLKNYPVMEFDEDKQKRIVESFKEKVISQKISQEEFEKTYAYEKQFLDQLFQKAKTTTYNTYSIEKDYSRTNPVVTALYHKLEKK